MREDAKASFLYARVFYVIMHSIILTMFLVNPNPFQESLEAFEIEPFVILSLKLVAGILLFIVGKKPGKLSESNFIDIIDNSTENDEWESPQQYWCPICQIDQPFRTKHCSRCEEWVAKFDHHCFWLGGCVGELNHGKFVIYLGIESYWLLYLAGIAFDSLRFSDFEIFISMFIPLMMTLSFGGLVFGLFVYHVYLISMGATTWEMLKRERIDYLKPYPKFFMPFSEGFLKNWKRALCTGNQINQWKLPRPKSVYPFNWCENQYWSCC